MPADFSSAAATSPQQTSDRPLRIHHLLVWIFVTACLFALTRSMMVSWQRSNPDPIPKVNSVAWGASEIILGGQTTALLFALGSRWLGRAERIQPGEWLAFIGAADGWLALIQSMIIVFCRSPDDVNGLRLIGYVQTTTYWASAPWFFVFLWLALTSKESVAWRFVYALLAIAVLPYVINPILWKRTSPYGTFSMIRLIVFKGAKWIALPSVCVAAYWDWRKHLGRRWSHWLGSSLYVIHGVVATMLPIS
jgi:hypothetical protein